jgi:hypothetical protein
MEFSLNGINITIMKYSNKGVIILLNDNKTFYRLLITIVNNLKIEILDDK